MPTTEQFEWFVKTALIHGLGFVLLAGIVGLILYGGFFGIRGTLGLVNDVRKKWLPQVVGGHLEFLKTTKAASETTAIAVQKLTESYSVSSTNHGKTHRALECIVKAQKSGEICNDAREHLDDAIRELEWHPTPSQIR